MIIDCNCCVMQHTRHCETCVVSVILNFDEGTGTVIDAEQERALRLLAQGGLVPPLRMELAPEPIPEPTPEPVAAWEA